MIQLSDFVRLFTFKLLCTTLQVIIGCLLCVGHFWVLRKHSAIISFTVSLWDSQARINTFVRWWEKTKTNRLNDLNKIKLLARKILLWQVFPTDRMKIPLGIWLWQSFQSYFVLLSAHLGVPMVYDIRRDRWHLRFPQNILRHSVPASTHAFYFHLV